GGERMVPIFSDRGVPPYAAVRLATSAWRCCAIARFEMIFRRGMPPTLLHHAAARHNGGPLMMGGCEGGASGAGMRFWKAGTCGEGLPRRTVGSALNRHPLKFGGKRV